MNLLLKMAIRTGNLDLVQFHVRRGGGDVNRPDHNGTSPLMYAAAQGRAEICQMLLDAGADPALKNHQGQDALSLASTAGHPAVKAVLLAAVAATAPDPDSNKVADKETAVTDGRATAEVSLSTDTVTSSVTDTADEPSTTARSESDSRDLTDLFPDVEEFDVLTWEAVIETPPPEGDPDCLDRARALHQILSHYTPVDTDADWSEVEIDLPDPPARRRGPADAERGMRIAQLLIRGLQAGRISRADLGCTLLHDEPDLDMQESLFGLAMTVVAYNDLAMVKVTLRQVHGAAAIDDGVSGYDLVHEMARVTERLETLVESRDWAVFQTLPVATMAAWLIATAGRVQLRKYRKHPRGPKKPPVKRTHDPRRLHVSVARLLAQRQ